ncbi:MAG: phosphoribosylaminoimidazolecarboxamide formyltransferase [Chloroflexi bacterium]|nr:phosphoribosylaminoimidazolecarboxamide formyltransferase [Chloroflexota bacterium]
MNELPLRYGMNPHQKPARVYVREGELPIRVRNGAPGYINLLDALNGWQLVRELKATVGLPAAASFKHVSPAGAAVGLPLSNTLRQAYFVADVELSPLATAYARARGADRVSSYGDWVALSDPLDVSTAELLRREVSDGVIAPGYEPEALEIVSRKKNGSYVAVEIDASFEAPSTEGREIFGVSFEQPRNDFAVSDALFENIVTSNRELTAEAKRDLAVATIALKYTQSNSVCLAIDGQVIGLGAGQQSRIHCTRLAAGKADAWWLRQHPRVRELKFRRGLNRSDRDNAIDLFLSDERTAFEDQLLARTLDGPAEPLAPQARRVWLDGRAGVSLSSDAFFPFRDNIDRAARSGVKYILQAGGALRDEDLVRAADSYGMVMVLSGVRLFHH